MCFEKYYLVPPLSTVLQAILRILYPDALVAFSPLRASHVLSGPLAFHECHPLDHCQVDMIQPISTSSTISTLGVRNMVILNLPASSCVVQIL